MTEPQDLIQLLFEPLFKNNETPTRKAMDSVDFAYEEIQRR